MAYKRHPTLQCITAGASGCSWSAATIPLLHPVHQAACRRVVRHRSRQWSQHDLACCMSPSTQRAQLHSASCRRRLHMITAWRCCSVSFGLHAHRLAGGSTASCAAMPSHGYQSTALCSFWQHRRPQDGAVLRLRRPSRPKNDKTLKWSA